MSRENFSTGGAWEPLVGYSRAVKVGDTIHVSGTTATGEDGAIVGENDPRMQVLQTLKNIDAALALAGATMADVVRTRLFVTDISRWEEYGRAHGEIFGEIRPANTMVEVSALIDPAMMVEIEVDAVVAS